MIKNIPLEHLQEDKKLTIAMFTNNYFPFIGGVPISISRLATGLRLLGHRVVIFAPKYPGDDSTEEDVVRLKLLIYLKAKLFYFPIVNIFSKNVDHIFGQYDFDIVHVHHPFWMGQKGISLAKKSGIPVVLTFHTRYDRYYKNLPFLKLFFKKFWSHRMIKRFAKNCDSIIAPVETTGKYLEHLGIRQPVYLLPTGVPMEINNPIRSREIREAYVNDDEVLLCSVSRLATEKNINFLIDCMEYLMLLSEVKFRCIIVGEGPEKKSLQKLITNKHLSGHVTLIGNIPHDQIHDYYTASDVFIFASTSETQGMVLIEAMAGGCPVVAVSSGGVDDVIVDGYNGYKSKEEIQDWVGNLMKILHDPDELSKMSHQALEYSQSFSEDTIAKRALEIYYNEIEK